MQTASPIKIKNLQLQSRIDRLEQQMGKHVEHRPGLLSAPKRLSTFADSDEGFTDYSEATAPSATVVDSQPTTLESRERQAIAEALARNGGRRKESAEELNISLRTLYRKIKEYGLE